MFYVASDSNGVIAGIVGGLAVPLYCNNDVFVGTEMFFYVRLNYREQGVGLLLIKAIEEGARELGLTLWHVVAFDHLDGARVSELYKKLGYKPAEHNYVKVL